MNFQEIYEEITRPFTNRPMLTWFEQDEQKSYNATEFCYITDTVASKLEQRFSHIKKGRWIGLKCKNHPLWYAVFFGLLKIGYPVLLLDSTADQMALEAFSAQAKMAGIVSDKEEALHDVTCQKLSDISISCYEKPVSVNWEHRIAFCTSGTTGSAKIYVFHADAVMEQTRNLRQILAKEPVLVKTGIGEEKASYPVLQTLPQRHCLGFGLSMLVWTWGYPMMLPEKEGIFSVADTCRKHHIWGLCTVPAIWKGLFRMAEVRFGNCQHDAMQKLLGTNMGLAVSAGARLNEIMFQKARQTGIDFWNGWGMTETSFVTIGDTATDESDAYVGVLVNQHQTKLLNEDESGCGELAVNGSTLYHALLVDGEEIPRDKETYFATGDLFSVRNGRYYFKGRCKSVMVREDGENIYLDELEMHFRFLENYAEQFCVFEYQEMPALMISSRNGITEQILTEIQNINYSLPQPKRIMKIYVSAQPLPLTSKGETARYHMYSYLEKNSDSIKELSAYQSKTGRKS